ncbi:1-(5-phosphoribosyl)-5-[(5-phosphoribosylamino)methylideneamino]imidazole-4-carboxamide isomerase [Luteimonas sp. 50]|uniref:1-(5-phosphoribosyl)-5-[(5-phosphoribosylamino)methylideneamino] imidazole-4-carboxamide isomerase n=1 Tax=Cognatiluteimonas sedimenti TaxID=2927791 RepID=A0ABT0A159_9GAMM|nr:1-(5-phosphoribosyl)-5-[(5-phosphoribosylamino)methylideneamino]imidazole-4-carboxamide isomerase [Lysobacter sedimenti]MCJ0824709.1 1-(5-phosphoribosyl)-5-[(5-phosphoribosylamino)methylideneamino]imidazole-4-carboxamide isomerase [Lysobacter sedimenti]
MSFTLYPAIDVRDGRVVRLRQGDYGAETRYGDDPLAFAVRHAQAGASWLHLVDLDAARAGGYTLLPLLDAIVAHTGLQVQTGGGVRSREDVAALLAAGAARVVVGSLAVREPDTVAQWLARFGRDRITVALDARQDAAGTWRLPVHGWTRVADETLEEVLARHADAGLVHLLCTDVARDGMLAGPNLELYRRLCERHPGLRVQASGGVRDMADLHASRTAGCSGAVLGRALLEGRIDLREALAC